MTNSYDEIEEFLPEVAGRVASESYDFLKCPTALDRMGPYHKQDVIAALIATECVISKAAILLNRSRHRVRDYIYGNRDVLLWFDDVREGNLDIIEHNHVKAALLGDLGAGRFILTTLGKDRGYSTRLEQTGKDGVPLLPPTLDFTGLSTPALKELRALGVRIPEEGNAG